MEKFYLASKNQTSSTLLINCRIIDPATAYDQLGELLIEGKIIKDFGVGIREKYQKSIDSVIDCQGQILAPGLIDIQVHFRDPGQSQKEDLVTGSKAAIAGGVTSVVCQPNTKPVIDNSLIVDYLTYKAREEAYCNIYAYASISKQMLGEELSEMGLLSQKEMIVGFTDDGLPVMNAYLMRRALEYSKAFNMVIAQHAEDLNLSNKGCINEGKISEELGVGGIANASESIIVARDIELVRLTGGKYHLLHLSTKEALSHIRQAKKENLPVTCEVAPHHFLLTEDEVLISGTNAKMNPPLRSETDRLALIDALIDGTIDAIATDHAPHEKSSKEKPLQQATFGIIGVQTLLPSSLILYHSGQMDLISLLQKLTCNPARIINIDRGRIEIGKIADLIVFDPEQEWLLTEEVLHSKSKNTPFLNQKMKGKVLKSFVAGSLVYDWSEESNSHQKF